MEAIYEGIVKKGSARAGFGTKVRELKDAEAAFVNDKPLEGEDETDLLLRKYGVGMDEKAALRRYEKAGASFDDDNGEMAVRNLYTCLCVCVVVVVVVVAYNYSGKVPRGCGRS